jgi:hypothetical protein
MKARKDKPTVVFHEVPPEYKNQFKVEPHPHPIWSNSGLSFTAEIEVDMKSLLRELIKPERDVNVIRYLRLFSKSKSYRKTRKYAKILGYEIQRRRK